MVNYHTETDDDERMTSIYLIRHAEAEGNLFRRAQGHWNGKITARGKLQIDALAERFKDTRLDAVYSSDLDRAVETAGALLRGRQLPFKRTPLLREINMGVWEGEPWGNITYKWPEQMYLFNNEPEKWSVPGGEGFYEVQKRMTEVILELAAKHDGGTIAAVSHGMAIKIFLMGALGLHSGDSEAMMHGDNTSVSKLEVEGDTIRVIYEGDNSHVPPELSTFRRQSWHKSSLATEPGLWFRTLRDDEAGMDLEAVLEEETAGRVAFTYAADALELEDFRLTPALRGQRYGAQLMGQAVKYARRRGLERVRLLCGPELADYFLQFGFAETGRRGEDRVMELDLRLIMREIPD